MPTATLPQLWRGRSGREYVPAEQARVRHGGMATVRKVVGKGPAVGTSTVPQGVPLALKLWNESDASALDQLQAEARVLVEISRVPAEEALPCPRLYDRIGDPLVVGVVMEWCPADLERWWRDKLKEPDAYGRLMATMAEAARRVSDYHVFFATRRGLDTAHGDLKPTNILLSQQGRWLISDFGAARVRPPDDNPLVHSKVVEGTENFLSPEALFHAKRRFPPAMDTWALGATAFALLRLQRMVLDDTAIPRNGTQSPRFRMQRINQIHEVYGRDPTRFFERDLDPEAFPEPLKLPEDDRRAIRDALRGAFGRPDDKREDELARETVEVFERAMSIEPKYRFTDARDLAAAFERLTRVYIELASSPEPADTGVLVRMRDQAQDRVRGLEDELSELRQQVAAAASRADDAEAARHAAEASALAAYARERAVPAGPPRWWSFALVVMLGFQAMTLLLVVGIAAWSMWQAGH